jgi:hypothetical protein
MLAPLTLSLTLLEREPEVAIVPIPDFFRGEEVERLPLAREDSCDLYFAAAIMAHTLK